MFWLSNQDTHKNNSTKHRLKPHSRIWSYPKKKTEKLTITTKQRPACLRTFWALVEKCALIYDSAGFRRGGNAQRNGLVFRKIRPKGKRPADGQNIQTSFSWRCVCGDVLRSALRNGIEDGRRYRVWRRSPTFFGGKFRGSEGKKECVRRTLVAVILTVSCSPSFWCIRSRF